ncbi:HAD-IC family P-type ATPase [Enterococcus dongliensis]|uniref:HAD-IC family P-type ATPase n=1 Tax=Enterococcus dongliensis TaxID=2559925 RepID=A0ABU3EPA8_9ENTE|nr:HAD-IC family P-type ATPase [Enterococcus dongliensis]MDT2596685.1 HAD-IC family P-type ATPase [Enterococcus dongliensis]MDT2604212.1 HAD-IC family P-type ATPase [Enterococcus dongliensis]MDT2634596.1 HAD-IC family P-type ATPase [Enterococcus dongliensis]MDT2642614.1 HAD-IC family P-type ATPase [Enterococcus dongliensis]MDT2645260.1 HAD-IC family P-type ATPase [Enterococcus dongliensis]
MKKKKEVQTVAETFDNVEIPADLKGLTAAEVQKKIEQGQTNQVEDNLLKTDKEIIKENTINIFNLLNLVLALLVLLVGSPKNTLFFGVVIINTLIGIIQELRAKHTIDQLSVLAKAKATVLRENRLQQIDQAAIVLGDIVYLRSGDQVPVDGQLVAGTGIEADESLLTGEADRVQKKVKDKLFSGSFITAGECFYQGTAVGKDNFAEQLTSEAKKKKTGSSELTKVLSRMIAVLTVIIIPVGLGLFYSQYQASDSMRQAVLGTVAALVSMIPEGLMLLTSVAFAVGAANLARKKVLVQALPSIETLARVDVICLDKTGTITDGTLKFETALMENISDSRFDAIMGALMQHLNDQNATAQALRKAFPASGDWQAEKVVPFSSARKWSGVTFKEQGSFVIGAPEFIFKTLPSKMRDKIQPYLEDGQRVLVLVESPETLTEEFVYEPQLLATLIISDNLRENARETFGYFAKQDVQLKVISGDHPLTVSKIAQNAGIENAEMFIDMSTLSEPIDYDALVAQTTVFGRVTPKQKQFLIRALKVNHTVCMTGDGVNDVLALREADIGVAMANGSGAARAASDVILLDSDFARMQNVLNEGRRVINNIERVASMYLVKTIYSLLLAVIFMFITNPYPFEPVQLTPINALTVGIPSFFLALKPSYERIKGDFLNNILRVSLPGALTVISAVMLVQLASGLFRLDYQATSTMSVFLTGCVGLLVLYKVSFPLDKKKIALITILSVAYVSCYLFFREFFDFDKLWNRNLFFVIPLTFGSYWLFKGLTFVMERLVSWRIRWQKRRQAKKNPQSRVL